MTLIDLGDVGTPPTAVPERRRPRRRSPAVALVALACALGLAASGTPAAPQLRRLWATAVTAEDGMVLGADTVYVARYGGGQAGLTAYALATGAARWARPLTGTAYEQGPLVTADGLLWLTGAMRAVGTTFDDGSRSTMYLPGELVALDPSTGAQRWRATGEIQHSTPASVLLADRDEAGVLRSARLLDTRTGAVRWQRPLPGVLEIRFPQTGEPPDRFVTTTAAGDVTVYRYADGAPLARRELGWAADGRGTVSTIAGDRLFVTRTDPRSATITGYRLDDLTELWSRRTLRAAYVMDCGPVLCLSTGAEVSGLDPATGEPRWLLTGRGGVTPAGAGRLIAYSNDEEPTQVPVDAASGRVLGAGGTGWPVPADTGTGDRLLLRLSATDTSRTVVSRLDARSGRVDVLGTLPSVEGGRCDASGHFLACKRPGEVEITAAG